VNAILFVQFKDAAKAGPLGFSVEYPYPVYQIEPVDKDDGSLSAQFLLANREGSFCWIDQEDLKRVKGQAQNGSGRKFQPNGQSRRGEGNRREPRERFGDRQYHDPVQNNPQYVNPQGLPQE